VAHALPPISARDVDFTGNHPMRNVDGPYADPEVTWSSSGTEAAPAISIDIDGNLSVKFEHYNNSDKSGTGVFQVYFAELLLPDSTTVPLQVNGNSGASASVSIPAYGSFWSPNFQISGWDPWIHGGQLRIGYLVDTTGIPGLVGYGMTREWRFLVNLEPPVGHMATVWHELLEETTAYAWGEDDPTQAGKDLTFGLYYAQRFAYPGQENLTSNWFDESNSFKLSTLLRTSGWVTGNCYDVAVYLHLLFESQGLSNEPLLRLCQRGPYDLRAFLSNDICPIGSDSTIPSNYNPIAWTNHCVVLFDGKIFDACLALQKAPDLSGYWNPPASWTSTQHWYVDHGQEFTGVAKRFIQPSEIISFDPPQFNFDLHLPHEMTQSEDTTFIFGGIL